MAHKPFHLYKRPTTKHNSYIYYVQFYDESGSTSRPNTNTLSAIMACIPAGRRERPSKTEALPNMATEQDPKRQLIHSLIVRGRTDAGCVKLFLAVIHRLLRLFLDDFNE